MQTEVSNQEITAQLVRDLIAERRSERRWKILKFFIKLMFVLLIIGLVFSSYDVTSLYGNGGTGYVSLIRLSGSIEPGQDFSAEEVIPLLKQAFTDKQSKGVILDINSGGGTPVQASIIHDAIVTLKNKYHKKVIVVGEDLLASGAYYIAVGADKIYVNANTITGSIGVVMKGFGFPDLIKKVGIERRVYTAGVNKDRLDPFLPQSPEDISKIKTVIEEVHNNFKNIVLEGRKNKLHADQALLFSGDFWSGESALKLGLVDGLGNLADVMNNEFQTTRYKNYGSNKGFMRSLLTNFGTSIGNGILSDKSVKLMERI